VTTGTAPIISDAAIAKPKVSLRSEVTVPLSLCGFWPPARILRLDET
jgi:hypothetical protein